MLHSFGRTFAMLPISIPAMVRNETCGENCEFLIWDNWFLLLMKIGVPKLSVIDLSVGSPKQNNLLCFMNSTAFVSDMLSWEEKIKLIKLMEEFSISTTTVQCSQMKHAVLFSAVSATKFLTRRANNQQCNCFCFKILFNVSVSTGK